VNSKKIAIVAAVGKPPSSFSNPNRLAQFLRHLRFNDPHAPQVRAEQVVEDAVLLRVIARRALPNQSLLSAM
jgi:hypothetical protein